MKRTLIFTTAFLWSLITFSQIPPGYYDQAMGQSGENLQEALHDIIDNHDSQSYSQLWTSFFSTDKKSNGKVWDMYSDVPGGTPPYQFTFYSDQCGNYGQEGDCYNREHSFPKSWFGGENFPMYTDLFQLYPTDGYVNNRRGNYPYGEVSSATWTSQNGCKVGNNTTPGYSGTVFEPIDDYKGDFARTYFYMATRYYEEDNSWPGSPMVDGSQPKTWALNMLHDWHIQDPVSDKEINRNNAVYGIQDNRNPFIDHPWFVDAIWFPTGIEDRDVFLQSDFNLYPNPVSDQLTIVVSSRIITETIKYNVTDRIGRTVMNGQLQGEESYSLKTESLPGGYYLLQIINESNGSSTTLKFVK